jgi:hypothetical protein
MPPGSQAARLPSPGYPTKPVVNHVCPQWHYLKGTVFLIKGIERG